jgi:hypothetical protein
VSESREGGKIKLRKREGRGMNRRIEYSKLGVSGRKEEGKIKLRKRGRERDE